MGRSGFLSFGNCLSFLKLSCTSFPYFSFSFSDICDFNFSSKDAEIAFPFVNRTLDSDDAFPCCVLAERLLFMKRREGIGTRGEDPF